MNTVRRFVTNLRFPNGFGQPDGKRDLPPSAPATRAVGELLIADEARQRVDGAAAGGARNEVEGVQTDFYWFAGRF